MSLKFILRDPIELKIRPTTATPRTKGSFTVRSVSKDNLQFSDLQTVQEVPKPLPLNQIKQPQVAQPLIKKQAYRKGLLLKQTKLFTAIKASSIKMIIANGFVYTEEDVNIKDSEGNTPLYYAAKNKHKEICQFLLDHGANVNQACQEGNTPLHMAFASNDAMVRVVI